MQVIPSIDLEKGRSRVVYWPGAASGIGAPTDRPDRIAEQFVRSGAPVIHLVDFDGARAGQPANLEAVAQVAARIAIPIQLAGGMEGPENIRLAFAAGATRVVLAMSVVEDPALLRECLSVAGDWLAVGTASEVESYHALNGVFIRDLLAAFPWRRSVAPPLETLVGELGHLGVHRLVLSHGGSVPDLGLIGRIVRSVDADVLVAGGVSDLDGIRRLQEANVAAIIVGEPLLSGAIDLPAALQAAA